MKKPYITLVAKGEWDKLVEIGKPAVLPLINALKDSNST